MNHKAKHYLVVLVKYALFWACLYAIYVYILDFSIDFLFVNSFLKDQSLIELSLILFLLLGLSCGNWYFEVLKWNKLVNTVNKIKFQKALKVSLIGHALSILTPLKAGDFATKIYAHKNTQQIILLNLFHQYTQLITTIVIGILFLGYFSELRWIITQFQIPNYVYYLIIAIAVFCFVMVYWWKRSLVFLIVNWIKINCKTAVKVQGLSFLKYFSFSLQYLILLRLFGVEVNSLLLYGAISATYLFASLIPSNFIVDIGIKTTWGVLIFGNLGVESGIIIFVSFTMWMLNFALPTLLGSFYIAKSKIDLSNSILQRQWSSL